MHPLLFALDFDADEPPTTHRERASESASETACVRVALVSVPFYGARVEERLLDARDPRVEPDDVPTHRSAQLAPPQSGTRLVAPMCAEPRPKPARSSMVVPRQVDAAQVDAPKKAKRRRRRRRAA